MERISRDFMFAKIAYIVAARSTCPRARVGAVLVKDNRIISTGYNGAPSGLHHCDDFGCEIDDNGSCTRTVHAEANVIAFAAKNGIPTQGSTLYTTVAPCYTCAKLLINAGVKEVVYMEPYRLDDGLRILADCGVEIRGYSKL